MPLSAAEGAVTVATDVGAGFDGTPLATLSRVCGGVWWLQSAQHFFLKCYLVAFHSVGR